MPVRIDAKLLLRQLRDAGRDIAQWLAPWGVLLAVAIAAGAAWLPARREGVALAVVSVVGLGGYAVVHVEARLVAPFLALTVVGGVAALRARVASPRRIVLAVLGGAVLWTLIKVQMPDGLDLACGLLVYLVLVARGARAAALAPIVGSALIAIGAPHALFQSAFEASQLAARNSMVDNALDVRTSLKAELFPEGRRIGVIGDGPLCAIWAREIRARIVAEVPESQAEAFWSAPDSVRMAVAHAMRSAGAEEIIATSALPETMLPGWHRIPDSRVARYALVEP